MEGTLGRERLIDNLIDIVFRQGERIARLEETTVTADAGGAARVSGVLIQARDDVPSAPGAGQLLIYMQVVDGSIRLRGIDPSGRVIEIANWSADGESLILRDRPDGNYWRLVLDEYAPNVMQLAIEAVDGLVESESLEGI
jgi:hypothetical protein